MRQNQWYASDATLVFSYMGYVTQEVSVNGQSTIILVMTLDLQALEKVVVVGYGGQSRAAVIAIPSKKGLVYSKGIPINRPITRTDLYH